MLSETPKLVALGVKISTVSGGFARPQARDMMAADNDDTYKRRELRK